jgi:hypothetical protein
MTIVDREGPEAVACEYYEVVGALLQHLQD